MLANRGHAVTHAYASELLTPRGIMKRKENDSISLSFVPVPMSPHYRANKYSFLKRIRYERDYGIELGKLLKRLQPDIVLSGQTPSDPQRIMIQSAIKNGIPVVTWVQDFYSLAVDKLARKKLPLIGALAGSWYRYLDAQCFRTSASIVAITEDFIPMLEELGVGSEKVAIIPNWAPLDELPLRDRRNVWSGRHGLDDKIVILYSGTLAMKHNPDLVRQLAVRFRDDPEVRIVVISEGPGADYLARVKESEGLSNLVLLPFQPFQDMPEILASADMLVAILESEAGVFSVPSKVLTYLAAGRPILGAMPKNNLATRIIQNSESGMCVDPEDTSGFIAAAVELRGDCKLRESLGRNGRSYAEAEFDIDRIADRFESVFVQVLDAKV